MKTDTATVTNTGNIQAPKSRKVGLDSKSLGVLMSILSNQYTDKHSAVLREYFVNGWDSHIASGRTENNPVVVSLPTTLQPSLIIEDRGRGLSEQELLETYGEYLLSDKRGDSDTTGGFGIGSKSAWTMGQQFIVIGVKDGIKTVALFALDEHGMGEVDIMHSSETEEPNGVLVSLAVSDVDAMQEAAARFFETVDRGTALVDEVEPTPIFESLHQINDCTWIRPNHDGEVYIVMGQVRYVVDPVILRQVAKRLDGTAGEGMAKALAAWQGEDTSVYFKADIDTVTVHPSRERLRDTEATLNGLASLITGMAQDMAASVQEKVSAAPSFYAAARALQDALDDLGAFSIRRKDVTYLGMEIPKQVTPKFPTYILTKKGGYRSKTFQVVRKDHEVEGGRSGYAKLDIDQAARVLVITGVKDGEHGKVTRYLKRFLEEGCYVKPTYQDRPADETRPDRPEWVMVTEQPWGAQDWFAFGTESGAWTMTLEEYKAVLKTLRTSSPRTINEPSYTTGWYTSAEKELDLRDLLSDIISDGKDVVLFYENSRIPSWAHPMLEEKYTPIVLLPTQSEDALRKRIEADGSIKVADVNVDDLVRQAAQISLLSVTAQEKDAIAARKWLSLNRNNWAANLKTRLGDKAYAKITHPVVQETQDVFDLAALVAEDITNDRYEEVEGLLQYAPTGFLTAFSLHVPDRDKHLPLLGKINWPYRWDSKDDREALVADMVSYINSKTPKA